MKFKDIKVGEQVLCRIGISHGWGKSTYFWVKKPVQKVTPKQFYVNDFRFKKEDGYGVGVGGYVAMEGETSKYSSAKLTDQTELMNEFVENLKKIRMINDWFNNFTLSVENKHIDRIFILAKEIVELSK